MSGKFKVTVIDLAKVDYWPHPNNERGKLNYTLIYLAMDEPHPTNERGKLNDTVIDLAKVEYLPHPTKKRGKLNGTVIYLANIEYSGFKVHCRTYVTCNDLVHILWKKVDLFI